MIANYHAPDKRRRARQHQEAMTALMDGSVDLRVVLAVPWRIEGHEVSGMKFHAPLLAIFLGLSGQKSESRAKSIDPERADFDVAKRDGAKLAKASLDGVLDNAACRFVSRQPAVQPKLLARPQVVYAVLDHSTIVVEQKERNELATGALAYCGLKRARQKELPAVGCSPHVLGVIIVMQNGDLFGSCTH